MPMLLMSFSNCNTKIKKIYTNATHIPNAKAIKFVIIISTTVVTRPFTA